MRGCRQARQKNLPKAVIDSEEEYRILLASISDAVLVTNDDGDFTFVCSNVETIFGYSSDEVEEMGTVSALLGDLNLDIVELRDTGEVQNIEVEVRDKWGSLHNLLVNVKCVASKGGTRLYTCHDVTERKRAERELQTQRERLVSVLEAIPAFVCLLTAGHEIRYANSCFRRLFGEPAGLTCYEVMRGRSQPCESCSPFDTCRAETAFQWKWSSEAGRSYMMSSTPLTDSDGSPLILVMGIDVTDKVAAEEKLRCREAELAHASRLSTLGEIASGLAHELNQPLGVICAYSDVCKAKIRSGKTATLSDTIEKIAQQAEQAAEIIRRIRSFVRKGEVRQAHVDMNTVVRDAKGLLELEAKRSGVDVRLELAEELPAVVADAIGMQQVLVNLMRNGIEAANHGASDRNEVTVSTKLVDGGRTLEVSVQDSGDGVDEEAAGRLFEPFYTTKAGGVGMGLAISQTIVQSHMGRLWEESQLGEGATFCLQIPTCGAVADDV